MFSFESSQAHAQRKRIVASAYSKTAISQQRIQALIRDRTAKVADFIEKQTKSDGALHATSGPIVVRNVFRALQSDIFTAFAFSDAHGTCYLENLKFGPNTLEDMGMDDMELLHDERRDKFFFWESEQPFKSIRYLIDRHGPRSHERAQRWLSELVRKHEKQSGTSNPDWGRKKQLNTLNSGLYDRLQFWSGPETAQPLHWKERASEIMDHAGSSKSKLQSNEQRVDFAVAGQDAVPAALEFIVRQISSYPEIQSRLQHELRSWSPLTAKDRTYAMFDGLPYLNAVVMEGLRTVDTISSYQTRVVPKRGCVVSGHFLPAGVRDTGNGPI